MESLEIERITDENEPHQMDADAGNETLEKWTEKSDTTVEQDLMIVDSLKLYLSQMGEVREDLLTREQEVRLAKLIEKGNEDAKRELIESNLKLVVSLTKGRTDNPDDHLDMIQNGALGLIRASEKFDWRKGFKFSTYATWWIRQSIQRGGENNSTTIRLPVHIRGKVKKIRKAQDKLLAIHKRAATLDEICEMTEFEDPAEVQALIDHDDLVNSIVPLDKKASINGDEGNAIVDFVADKDIDVLEGTIQSIDVQVLNRIIDVALDEKERDVITRRYGIREYDTPMTLDEIAKDLGFSKENIRLIETSTIEKLRYYVLTTGMIEPTR